MDKPLTVYDFKQELKALLKRAEDSGLGSEEVRVWGEDTLGEWEIYMIDKGRRARNNL